jgi:flavin reductase (DIM6/NTAB) family NADH-FMN oxidoreductase RutF/pimeloyl-ACP methyl ester carboxylesterase
MEVRKFKGYKGVTLAADVGGDKTDPAVILLHGTGRTRHTWARTARDLVSAGRYVIALDLRGHGDSDWAADKDYSLDAHLADLAAVIAELDTTPTLVGHLAGGWIALAAASESGAGRDYANALVLADVALRFGEEVGHKTRALMLTAPEGFASLEEAAFVLESHFPDEKLPQRTANLRRCLRLQADGRWHWHYDPAVIDNNNSNRVTALDGERIEWTARKIRVPTMCIRGRMGELLERAHLLHLQSLIPQAECVTVQAAGPGVITEAEEEFDAALVGFLEKAVRRPSYYPPRSGVDAATLRQALGCFGTGVAVITTLDASGRPVGLTANSFTSVSLDPPLVLFCVDRRAGSLPTFEQSSVYAVNILHIGQQDISMRFVQKGIDRFADVPWETWERGAPVIQDCFASFECERHQIIDGGDHRIFIARVRRVRFDASRDPLLYLQGRYRRVHVDGRGVAPAGLEGS